MQARIGLWVSQGGRLDIRQQLPISPSMLQPDEYLIRVLYSGLNPADQKHSIFLGICDLVAGYDFAGTVVARGSDRLSLLPGALVCGLARTGLCIGNQQSGLHGAHQQFLVASAKGVFPLPAHTSDEELQVLATMPAVTATAADCLFGLLGLDATPSAKNKAPLLVWGAALPLATPSSKAMRELSPGSHDEGCLRLAIDATGMNHADIYSILADASAEAHADGAIVADKVRWAIRHLGSQFHQVPVEVLDGGWPALIPGVTRVSAGGMSFGKLVFRMPQEEDEGTGSVAGAEKLV
ncbi:alcohol dehydrogenase [Botrytis cinerea]